MALYTIALAGNPNAGKSTVFNVLTGLHQHVGNWPGKTVEKKTGLFQHRGHEIEVIDLLCCARHACLSMWCLDWPSFHSRLAS